MKARAWNEALRLLKAAAEIRGSQRINRSIALLYHRLGRYEEAYVAAQACVSDKAEIQIAEACRQMAAEIEALRAAELDKDAGWIVLREGGGSHGTIFFLDGRVVPGGTKLRVKPGRVEVSAIAPGRESKRESVDVSRGRVHTVEIALGPLIHEAVPVSLLVDTTEAYLRAGDLENARTWSQLCIRRVPDGDIHRRCKEVAKQVVLRSGALSVMVDRNYPGLTILVGGTPARASEEVLVSVGPVTVEVMATGYERHRRVLQISRGQREVVEVSLVESTAAPSASKYMVIPMMRGSYVHHYLSFGGRIQNVGAWRLDAPLVLPGVALGSQLFLKPFVRYCGDFSTSTVDSFDPGHEGSLSMHRFGGGTMMTYRSSNPDDSAAYLTLGVGVDGVFIRYNEDTPAPNRYESIWGLGFPEVSVRVGVDAGARSAGFLAGLVGYAGSAMWRFRERMDYMIARDAYWGLGVELSMRVGDLVALR